MLKVQVKVLKWMGFIEKNNFLEKGISEEVAYDDETTEYVLTLLLVKIFWITSFIYYLLSNLNKFINYFSLTIP